MVSQAAPLFNVEEQIPATSRYLEAEMARLRLLLHRRLLWLRQRWQRESGPGRVSWAITDQEAGMLLEGEDRWEELSFRRADEAAGGISKAIDDAVSQLDALRREMEEMGTPAPIDILAARFDLNAFERDVVLLCMAPELDPGFERIYAYVQDDAAKRYPTPHLALTALADGFTESERASFFPAAALRHWRLIRIEPDGPGGVLSSALRMDERVLNYLLGMNCMDGRCRGILSKAPDAPLAACHRDQAAALTQWLMSAGARGSKRVNLVGQSDSGRLALSHAVCEQAGLDLVVIDPRSIPPAAAERRELIALVDREAALLRSALYLDADVLKPEESQALLASMDRLAAPLFLASRERFACERETLTAPVSRPDAASQADLWKRLLGPSAASLNGQVEGIVEQFDLGPASIVRAVALASHQATLRSPEQPIEGDDLWQACRQQAGPQIEQLARKISLCYDWDDIVVPPEVLRQLQEITAQVAHRHHVYQQWGFGKKLNRGRGITALFSGASGVGKTMAAEVIAQRLKLDLYRIDLAGVVSKYIGETEKNLRSVFDAAERSGAILFFDEADALFGKRSEVKDSHDRYANIEINYLLQRMEDYRGLAILATNMKASMDNAFTRRLRFIVDFPFPDPSQRIQIWRRVFPPEASVKDLDYGALSRLEIAGGSIRNIAVNAAFLAAEQGTAIGMEQVMRAARREYAKIDRLIMDGEFGRFAGAGAP